MILCKKQIIRLTGLAVCLIAMPVFAESAPVYDADDIQQQLESAVEPEQDLPPPPPPGESVFIPPRAVRSAQPVDVTTGSIAPSTDQRLKRVEQQVNHLQSNSGSARVEALQSEIQALRGQVEQLTRQLQQLQGQQKTLYSDIDRRLADQNAAKSAGITSTASNTEAKAAETKSTEKPLDVAAKAAKPAEPEQPNVAEEQQIYQNAYNLIKAKKYEEAVTALQDMLQKYPSGQFASNAHYWLGELYGLMGKNDDALSQFAIVVQRYPDSPRVSDAQLKIGLLFATQTKWSEARAAFKKVISRYPGTASSRLASEQLKQIKDAGH